MRDIDEDTITQAVIARHAGAGDARLRELMTSLVQHLHAFAREVRITEAENENPSVIAGKIICWRLRDGSSVNET